MAILPPIQASSVETVSYCHVLPSAPYNRMHVLRVLHEMENPTNTLKPGPNGELGKYQFTRDVWEQTTSLPFTEENVWAQGEGVALKRIRSIERGLTKEGYPITYFLVALVWNGGFGALDNGSKPTKSLDYATRFWNLYNSELPDR